MTTVDRPLPAEALHAEISKRIGSLQARYVKDEPSAVAALARLRRGLGKEPGSVLDIVELTYHPDFARGAVSDEPTTVEVAAHLGMTLFALHQQSQPARMHLPGARLGTAIRRLVPASETNPSNHSIGRRFSALITADSLTELTHHLRGAVQLLRANGVPLDYGQFVKDLYFWQNPRSRGNVRRGWARGFHKPPPEKTTTTTEQGE